MNGWIINVIINYLDTVIENMQADLQPKKRKLIEHLINLGFLKTPAVIKAFQDVSREKFVPAEIRKYAYVNEPLPIGFGQTISQPLTVAAMTEALDVGKGMKILEIGAGSGYQAAILSHIVGKSGKIVTIERIRELAVMARKNLESADADNVEVVENDGSKGYSEDAPYDRIIVTASANSVPQPLVEQLKAGGKMVIPVGNELWLIEKDSKGEINRKMLGYYAFVPLIEG